MKFIVIFSVLLCLLQSCNTDRTAENERLDLVTSCLDEVQLSTKQQDVQLKSIHLNYPKLSDKRFNDWMLHMVQRDTIGVYCTEQEYLDITYKVEHFSKSLFCLSKLVKVKCPMGNKNFQLNEVQTYFLKNDSIFKVDFEAHADFTKSIANKLETRSMRRCTQPDMNRLEFLLRKGHFYVRVPYDFPMCDTIIPFKFEKNTVKVASLTSITKK
ncbi:MAG: hypothetical protein RLZZ585_1471 [Bacteroidota bacterium]|jgi:hypothetical protein